MIQYLEFCQFVAPYLIATIGLLVMGGAIALLALLVAQLWYVALQEWVQRFKSTIKNLNAWNEFRQWRKEKIK